MIKELVQFTASLGEEFKNLGTLPKEGLHICIKTVTEQSGQNNIDMENFEYELYFKKQKEEISDFLNYCKLLLQNAWCIDTNKCFDLPTKAIHTCSPYAVAFKREHLEGGTKYKDNIGKKKQIYERFDEYFNKAFGLLTNKADNEKIINFKHFFIHNSFSAILQKIEKKHSLKREQLEQQLISVKGQIKASKNTSTKEEIKNVVNDIEQQLLKVRRLEESDYIIFYLDVPFTEYQQAHKKYLDDKLFNTALYNTKPNAEGVIFGTSNFMNGFNSNMPFLMHQTATFDISGRISNIEARLLYELINIFPNKTLPNPLPIFIYQEELQKKAIAIFRESENRFGYKEIIQALLQKDSDEISNYYLLFWQNTIEGIVFRDFDFVSRFDYKLPSPVAIQNLFEIKEKGGNENKHYPLINTTFDIEEQIFKKLIQNKYLRLDYFGELKKEDYEELDLTYFSYCKYRKAVYDYVYKSQRNTIDGKVFYEMIFNSILDDVKNSYEYGIRNKLNIWYSLYQYFNSQQKISMANKLKEYQDFVAAIISEEPITEITDEKFAFAAGQVIEYIQSNSESNDNSYNFLEPYLQQAKCDEFKRAIANNLGRYKHKIFTNKFEKVAAFVLTHETSVNLKNLLPQVLSGVFAKNQLKP